METEHCFHRTNVEAFSQRSQNPRYREQPLGGSHVRLSNGWTSSLLQHHIWPAATSRILGALTAFPQAQPETLELLILDVSFLAPNGGAFLTCCKQFHTVAALARVGCETFGELGACSQFWHARWGNTSLKILYDGGMVFFSSLREQPWNWEGNCWQQCCWG